MKRSEFARLLHRAAEGLRISVSQSAFQSPLSIGCAMVLSQPGTARDLQSIIDANLLRVAVTPFDLPSFHAHRADGTLVGARSKWPSKSDRR